MREGLAQGPYMAAGVDFEPVTFQTQGTELTTEPPRPIIFNIAYSTNANYLNDELRQAEA